MSKKTAVKKKPTYTRIDHPLAQHKLSLIRKRKCSTSKFYSLTKEIGMFLCFEMTKVLSTQTEDYGEGKSQKKLVSLKDKKPAVIAMMRSGLVLAEGFRTVNPSIKIGHMGVHKRPDNGEVIVYMASVPDLEGRAVIILDMNVTTGSTAITAIDKIKEHQLKTCLSPQKIFLGCVTAKPIGLAKIAKKHDDVSIFTVSNNPTDAEGQFGYYSNKLFGLTPDVR